MSHFGKISLLLIICLFISVVSPVADNSETYFDFLKATYNRHDKQLNDFLKAEFELFIAFYPESEHVPEALYLLAQTFLERKAEHEGFALLMKALYLYPDNPVKTSVVAEAQRIVATNSSYKRQQGELRKIIDGEFPGGEMAERFYRYLKFLRELDDRKLYSWTLAEYYEVIERFKDDSRVEQIHRWLGDVYASMGEAQAAVAAYQKYEKLFPVNKNLPYVIINRANVLNEDLKDYALANSLLTQVIENYPETKYASTAMFSRAKIKEERFRDYDGAIADYRQLIKQDPQHEKAVEALFEIASINVNRLRALRSAIDTYNEVVQKYPESPRGVKALKESAALYLKMKDPYSAAKQYARIAELYPDHVEAPAMLFEAGEQALGKIKDFQMAKEYYNLLIEKYPGNVYADKAQQRIIRINEKQGP